MFDSLQLEIQWRKACPSLRPWVGLPGAFAVGLLVGMLWAGALPFDWLRVACLAGLVAEAILSVIAFNPRPKSEHLTKN